MILKTVLLSNLDVMREDIVQKLAKGVETSKVLGCRMPLGGSQCFLPVDVHAAVNATKDLILGRPVEISDEQMDVAMQMIGISRYAI